MSDLFLTFPVSGIDFLGDSMKTIESARFTNVADLILDSIGEAGIEVVVQSTITISLNLGHDSIEVNHIAIHVMGVIHAEMIELVLGIGNRVMWTERGLELYDELMPAGHPQRTCVRIIHS